MSKAPPTSTLSTPSSFSNLDWSDPSPADEEELLSTIHSSGDGQSESAEQPPDDDVLCFSAVDLSDAFYQLGWQGLSSFMCLDHQVAAGEFNVTDAYDEVLGEWESVSRSDLLYPALAVLPWGFHGLFSSVMTYSQKRCSRVSRGGCRPAEIRCALVFCRTEGRRPVFLDMRQCWHLMSTTRI